MTPVRCREIAVQLRMLVRELDAARAELARARTLAANDREDAALKLAAQDCESAAMFLLDAWHEAAQRAAPVDEAQARLIEALTPPPKARG